MNMDQFYKVMGDFYGNDQRKHASPTKRLMQQKDAAWAHKAHLSKNLSRTDEYSITYVTDPHKTYVIQPTDGEINYSLATKNPLKFYDKVMNQDVMEHKVEAKKSPRKGGSGSLPGKKIVRKSKTLEMKSRMTKRAIAHILLALQSKLVKLVSQVTEENLSPEEFHRAMTNPEVQEIVQKHILSQNIQMVEPNSRKPVYKK